jgi:hypothetical protein
MRPYNGGLWFDWTWQTSLIAFGSQWRGLRLCPKDGERGRDGAKTATSGTNNGKRSMIGDKRTKQGWKSVPEAWKPDDDKIR